MAGIIEIKDKQEGVLTLELYHLLTLIGNKAANLVWSILDLEAVADPEKFKTDLLELERVARESPNGLTLRWDELVVLAQALKDVWNILLAAAKIAESIPRLEYLAEDVGPCEIVIECLDSDFWRVYARDDEIIRRLEQSFRDVTVKQL